MLCCDQVQAQLGGVSAPKPENAMHFETARAACLNETEGDSSVAAAIVSPVVGVLSGAAQGAATGAIAGAASDHRLRASFAYTAVVLFAIVLPSRADEGPTDTEFPGANRRLRNG